MSINGVGSAITSVGSTIISIIASPFKSLFNLFSRLAYKPEQSNTDKTKELLKENRKNLKEVEQKLAEIEERNETEEQGSTSTTNTTQTTGTQENQPKQAYSGNTIAGNTQTTSVNRLAAAYREDIEEIERENERISAEERAAQQTKRNKEAEIQNIVNKVIVD